MAFTWDPDRYLVYGDERARPFLELLGRIPSTDPATVTDLGCGPGNLTALLRQRWPDATIRGLDSSPEMITAAAARGDDIEYAVADLRDWLADDSVAPVDVLVSNAALQWVPGHLDLLPALVAKVVPGGCLAFQVPGNFGEPSHTIRAELAATPPYDAHVAGIADPASHDPATYLDVLAGLGCEVDAWETTYLHVLDGQDPVFTWVSGTGARPTLEALAEVGLREEFEKAFKARLSEAYPHTNAGVVLPFRRVFVVTAIPR